jgi:hypothetical protein
VVAKAVSTGAGAGAGAGGKAVRTALFSALVMAAVVVPEACDVGFTTFGVAEAITVWLAATGCCARGR